MPEIEEVFLEESEDEKKKKAAKKKTGTTEQKSAAKAGSGGKTNPIEDAANGAIETFQLDEDELIGASSSPTKSRNKPMLMKGVSAFVPDTSY